MQNVSRDRYVELVDLAEGVCDSYPDADFTDPERIAREEHISLSFGNYSDAFDGMLEFEAGCFHIYCNLDRVVFPQNPRARFTLAHELGHYFIDEHRNALKSRKDSRHPSFCEQFTKGSIVELEADIFASNLLMPPSRLKAAMKKGLSGADAIKKLANRFKASLTATAIQYTKLSSDPIVIIKWKNGKIEWRNGSPLGLALGFTNIHTDLDHLMKGSATQVALNNTDPSPPSHERSNTLISAWSNHIHQGTSKDIIMVEDALYLGEYGVITILHPADSEKNEVNLLKQTIIGDNFLGF